MDPQIFSTQPIIPKPVCQQLSLIKLPLIIGVALLLMTFGIGGYWLGNKQIDKYSQILPTAAPSLLPSRASFLKHPTPTFAYVSIDMPRSEIWVKYSAICPGLKDDITIYYPDSWKAGQYGEEKISDVYQNTPEAKARYEAECFINFGYPKAPGSRQNSGVPGLFGYIKIDSSLTDLKNIDELEKQYAKDPYLAAVYPVNLYGRDYLKILPKASSSVFSENETTLLTIYKDKLYEISYTVLNDLNADSVLDTVSTGHLLSIGEEFVKRIEFH